MSLAAWLLVAFEELALGVHELPDQATHPRIKVYLDSLDTQLGPAGDETPWCAAFVHWCLLRAGLRGTGKPNARSYLKWGSPVLTPTLGCVAVFWRGSPASWQGHVAFLLDRSFSQALVLGGNQGNRVSVASYPLHQALGFRSLL